jgi:ribonuclease P protein component
VKSADFERVLGSRSRLQSSHFALHHVDGSPLPARKPRKKLVAAELSTDMAEVGALPVDDFPRMPKAIALDTQDCGVWLGTVVPKRHARRAVTRSLLKRQIRAAVAAHAERLASGLWVVRLRAGFDRATFASAASDALGAAARTELDGLLSRCSWAPPASA